MMAATAVAPVAVTMAGATVVEDIDGGEAERRAAGGRTAGWVVRAG